MAALLISIALFGIAWLAHLAWWRIRLPKRHSVALLALFAAVPLGAAIIAPVLPAGLVPALAEIPAVLGLYLGAAACYLIVYTGIEQSSPTLVIVRALERAAGQGCTSEELAGVITDDLFVRPRLEALALDGILASTERGWALTSRGRQAARAAAALAALFRIRVSA
jgi:hypothetical protein